MRKKERKEGKSKRETEGKEERRNEKDRKEEGRKKKTGLSVGPIIPAYGALFTKRRTKTLARNT